MVKSASSQGVACNIVILIRLFFGEKALIKHKVGIGKIEYLLYRITPGKKIGIVKQVHFITFINLILTLNE
jgi:hypothetical protein